MFQIIGLPGLGANECLFENQKVGLPEFYVFPWIEPKPQESLRDYSARFASKIDFDIPTFLMGFSFGSQIALEIARTHPVKGVFIVSGFLQDRELPQRFLKQARLLKRLPQGPLKSLLKLGIPTIGTNLFAFQEHLDSHWRGRLRTMAQEINHDFLIWAIAASADWSFTSKDKPSCPLFSIHGQDDWIIPLPQRPVDLEIKHAKHLILWKNAPVIHDFVLQKIGELKVSQRPAA